MTDPLASLRRLVPETAVAFLFLAVLAWAPLPAGSNPTWAEDVLALALAALLFLWSALVMTGLALQTPLLRNLRLPALCVALALGWAGLQQADLAALASASGLPLERLAYPVWQLAGEALQSEVTPRIAVDVQAAAQAMLPALSAVMAFLLAFCLGRDRMRAPVLAHGLVWLAVAWATLGMIAVVLRVDITAWLVAGSALALAVPAAPFVNPEHFGVFMALGAIAALGLGLERLREAMAWGSGWRATLRSLGPALNGSASPLLLAAEILVIGVLLTQAVVALAGLLVGILALALVLVRARAPAEPESAGRRAMVALLVIVLGIAVCAGRPTLMAAGEDAGPTPAERLALATASLAAIKAAPLRGHGFGGFEHYVQRFADGTLSGTVREAHNDLLETVADLGLPFGLCYLAAPLWLAARCATGIAERRRDRAYPAVAVAATAAVAIFALGGFSLQIPAIAVTYAALLGIGTAHSWRMTTDMVR